MNEHTKMQIYSKDTSISHMDMDPQENTGLMKHGNMMNQQYKSNRLFKN